MYEIIAGTTTKQEADEIFVGGGMATHKLAVLVRGGRNADESFVIVGRLTGLKRLARRGTWTPSDIEWRVHITNLSFELAEGDVLRLYDPTTEEVDIFLGRVGANGKLSTGQRVTDDELDYVRQSVMGDQSLPFHLE